MPLLLVFMIKCLYCTKTLSYHNTSSASISSSLLSHKSQSFNEMFSETTLLLASFYQNIFYPIHNFQLTLSRQVERSFFSEHSVDNGSDPPLQRAAIAKKCHNVKIWPQECKVDGTSVKTSTNPYS